VGEGSKRIFPSQECGSNYCAEYLAIDEQENHVPLLPLGEKGLGDEGVPWGRGAKYSHINQEILRAVIGKPEQVGKLHPESETFIYPHPWRKDFS